LRHPLKTSHLTTKALAGGGLLVRNSLFNLIGQGIPLLVALFTIPLLIHGLGTDRFGVLTLAWMVIGYFSLFDLGLGRALAQVVAEKLSAGEERQLPPLVWTALVLMFVLGLLGALVVSLISPWLVHSGLKIPDSLQAETLDAFYMLAVGVPIVIITAGLAGILSAFQRFGILNAIRVPVGIYSFLAPLLILSFSQNLFLITALLVIGRLVACSVHFAVCLRVMPALRSEFTTKYAAIKPLFHFGAWMTITNVVGPLMVYLDRFVVGAVISMAAVTYYATPYEMVTKLWIFPGAIVGVLFPAFAATYVEDHDRMVQIYTRGTKYIALILFPVILVITAFAHEGLQWWLGDEFARHSTPVLQWLAIGVFINSLALVFIALIQGIGRPDLSAKLHFLELLIYVPILWWAIQNYGILGAAIAWTGRVALDGILLFWLSSRFLGNKAAYKRMAVGMLVALGGLIVPLGVDTFTYRAVMVFLMMVIFVFVVWITVLAPDERMHIDSWMRSLIGRSNSDVRQKL
jgi:O-antigen/teichoic acid export membrane protein